MRPYLCAAALLAAFATTSPALAQHAHGDKTGPNGGRMQDVVGIEAELVASGRTVTVNLFTEDGKPVPAAGYSGSALVGTGSGRQVLQLAPGSGNALNGTAGSDLAKGTAVTLQLKAPDGRSGQAKF